MSKLIEIRRSYIIKAITLFGKIKYVLLRERYKAIRSGLPIPKYTYSFRISANKKSFLTNILHVALELKSGMLRKITITQHISTNLSVYETGWKSKRSQHESYRKVINMEDQVGRPTLMEVLKLFTKRGVPCTSYCHSIIQFNDILLRLKYFK